MLKNHANVLEGNQNEKKLNIKIVDAHRIIDEVREITSNFIQYAQKADVPKNIQLRLKRVFENISI